MLTLMANERIAASCSFVLILWNSQEKTWPVCMFMCGWCCLASLPHREKGWTRQMKCLPVQINSSTSNNTYIYIYIHTCKHVYIYLKLTYRIFTVVAIRCICETQSAHLRGLFLLYPPTIENIYVFRRYYMTAHYVLYMFMGNYLPLTISRAVNLHVFV